MNPLYALCVFGVYLCIERTAQTVQDAAEWNQVVEIGWR